LQHVSDDPRLGSVGLFRCRQHYESQLAQLRQPQLNIPIYDIFSQESIRRSGDQSEVNRVAIPQTTKYFTLILNGEGQLTYPDYVIEIMDRKGQLVWRGEGLRRDSHGNVVMTLDKTFLGEGQYRLQLYGQRGGRTRRIAEYIVFIE
jgi:hypothetical protein